MEPQSRSSARPFEWVGGRLGLDFTNTVSWSPEGLKNERLREYGDLVDWGVGGGVLTADRARELTKLAEQHPAAARQALERARLVRELLHRLLAGIADGATPEPALVQAFNSLLTRALSHLRLGRGADQLVWALGTADLDAVLHPVVWSAAQLLSSGDRALLRRCDNEHCGWLFVDESRNKRRRWCDMRDCGNRAKARRYYETRIKRKRAEERGSAASSKEGPRT